MRVFARNNDDGGQQQQKRTAGGGGGGWTPFVIFVLAFQVFLTTVTKNDFLLEYFDAMKIVSKFDEMSTTGGGGGKEKDNNNNNNFGDAVTILSQSVRVENNNNYEDEDDLVREEEEEEEEEDQEEDLIEAVDTAVVDVATTTTKNETKKKGGERQRVVIMAGPHKTASTTLQDFVAMLAQRTVQLDETSGPGGGTRVEPHPVNPDWVFPVGLQREYSRLDGGDSVITGSPLRHPHNPDKFYAILASFISGRRINMYFPEWGNDPEGDKVAGYRLKTRDYFRGLMRRPWEEGKNLVVAAEAFDTLVERLVAQEDEHREGEDLHVSDDSGLMIDGLLDIFPFDEHDENDTENDTENDDETALRLTDFEVHMNLRTPRIGHLTSIWHQLGHKQTLRIWLRGSGYLNLYQMNTLGLALQFCRKGLPVTILDMMGVREKESREEQEQPGGAGTEPGGGDDDVTVVGGLQGIVGCEILRMDGVCDGTGKMLLPGFSEEVSDQNVKSDRAVQNVTPDQLERMGKVLDAYDCAVWKHLKAYRERGLLRILYPSEHLFETCSGDEDEDFSFREAVRRINGIAMEDNGIPISPEEAKKNSRITRKENKGSRKERKILERMTYLENRP